MHSGTLARMGITDFKVSKTKVGGLSDVSKVTHVPEPGRVAELEAQQSTSEGKERPQEIGGYKGPDPTRYGDWERNGRCVDF